MASLFTWNPVSVHTPRAYFLQATGDDTVEVEIGPPGNPDTDWFNLQVSFSGCGWAKKKIVD